MFRPNGHRLFDRNVFLGTMRKRSEKGL